MKTNFHTHSSYCDGKAPLHDFVEMAVNHGFSALGFSGHAPVPFDNTFAIPQERYLDYCREVRALQAEYADRIEITLGLEVDYIPGLLEDFSPLIEQGGLDYTIGSVHLIPGEGEGLWFIDGSKQETYDEGLHRLFGGDIRRGVRAYFHQQNDMLLRNRPTIVGHPDKIVMHNRDRYFREDEPWYEALALETLSLVHELGLICEVNTRGIYKSRHADYYPSRRLIRQMKQWRIPLLVSTDAHQPDDLLRTEGAHQFLQEIAYPEVLSHWRR